MIIISVIVTPYLLPLHQNCQIYIQFYKNCFFSTNSICYSLHFFTETIKEAKCVKDKYMWATECTLWNIWMGFFHNPIFPILFISCFLPISNLTAQFCLFFRILVILNIFSLTVELANISLSYLWQVLGIFIQDQSKNQIRVS